MLVSYDSWSPNHHNRFITDSSYRILYINNMFLLCCERDLAFYRSAALPWGWTLGEGGFPTGLVVVSETFKDNAEQLWVWRVQIISNSWQQLVTSSRPNSCHDIVCFMFLRQEVVPCPNYIRVGVGSVGGWIDYLSALKLGDELLLSNSFTGFLDSHMLVLEI